MGKQRKIEYGRIALGVACLGILGVISTLMACPMTSQAYADDQTTTEAVQSVARVMARPVLAVAITPVVTIDIVPRANGAYGSGVAELKVSTNSRNGFAVLMNGADGTDLVSTRGSQDKITTISTASALADFPANTWGYYIGEQAPTETSLFDSIPAVATEIKSTETSTENQTYKVAFGTKIDASLEAGMYSNAVVISVVANPLEVSVLQDLYYMQDMTPEVCAATTVLETSKELIDTRDNKVYKVAKLKDGNCWMQENLRLELTTSGLSAMDTDITENWDENSEYPPVDTVAPGTAGTSATSTISWQKDNVYWYTFNAATAGHGASVSSDKEVVKGSICPKGWSLPLAGSKVSGSYDSLLDTYGVPTNLNGANYANIMRGEPILITLSDYVTNGALENKQYGPWGMYWSAVSGSNDTTAYTYSLNVHGWNSISSTGLRSSGSSVRCVVISSSTE